MKNKLIPSAVTATVAASLVFGLSACSQAPDGFEDRCDKAGGEVTREDDFDGETLGMAPMAFSAGKGGGSGSRSGSRGSSSGSSSKGGGLLGGLFGGNDSKKSDKPKSKAPSTRKKNDGWKLADSSKSRKPSKKSKSKSHDDNDWLCVKDGVILFEEDE